MEVLYHTRPYFVGISPYIGLINSHFFYGRYLQSIDWLEVPTIEKMPIFEAYVREYPHWIYEPSETILNIWAFTLRYFFDDIISILNNGSINHN